MQWAACPCVAMPYPTPAPKGSALLLSHSLHFHTVCITMKHMQPKHMPHDIILLKRNDLFCGSFCVHEPVENGELSNDDFVVVYVLTIVVCLAITSSFPIDRRWQTCTCGATSERNTSAVSPVDTTCIGRQIG